MAQYGTIITNIGLAQIANAQITQTKVGLEYIALGDGNGAHYVPKQNQTALVHEVWRGPIAELSIDPTNSNRIIIDAVIPVTAGGFTIREIGIFDDKNNLIAIGQYPEKYKPQLSEGVSEETIIHFVIETNNADVVKLTIDPTVIIASRNYVDGKVAQVQTALTEHSGQIATTEELGHFKPDGTTITVDPETGIASAAITEAVFSLLNGDNVKQWTGLGDQYKGVEYHLDNLKEPGFYSAFDNFHGTTNAHGFPTGDNNKWFILVLKSDNLLLPDMSYVIQIAFAYTASVSTYGNLHVRTSNHTKIFDTPWKRLTGNTFRNKVRKGVTGNAIGIGTFADSTLAVSQIGGKNDTGKFFVALNPTGFAIGENVKLKYRNSDELLDAKITNIVDAGGDMKTFYLETTAPLNNDLQIVVKLGGNAPYQTAMGEYTFSSGRGALTEGLATIAIGEHSHAEGRDSIAGGVASHVEGMSTKTIGEGTHAEGNSTEARGHYSHAEGSYTIAIGNSSHAEGNLTEATGNYSHAEGTRTQAIGEYSHSSGNNTSADVYSSTAIGRYNKPMTGSSSVGVATDDAFVIGNGTSPTARSNAFRVRFNGAAYGLSAYNSTGADYAEYFEWLDGNMDDDDRVGFVVALDGAKIRKATADDTYILGIISANPSVIGDSYQDDWNDKYVTDEWGRIQYHWVDVEYEETVPVTVEIEGGGYVHTTETVIKTRQDYVPMLNKKWNNDEEYIPREERKEWDAVGLMGKLLVRDNGTCEVNGYAKIGSEDGILTISDERTDMRVIERVAPNIVRVFIK